MRDDISRGPLPADLRVSGPIYRHQSDVEPVLVTRGMIVLTRDGHEAGRVAAVALDGAKEGIDYLLLAHTRPVLEYRMVPSNLIERVHGEWVLLNAKLQAVEQLPIWHAS